MNRKFHNFVNIRIAYKDKHVDKVYRSGEIDFIERHFIMKVCIIP